MTHAAARTAVVEWIELAQARGAAAVAALGVTTMPTLALKMLAHAMPPAADVEPIAAPDVVEVASWTSIDDVNALLAAGAGALLAAGIREGAAFFVVGRYRAVTAAPAVDAPWEDPFRDNPPPRAVS